MAYLMTGVPGMVIKFVIGDNSKFIVWDRIIRLGTSRLIDRHGSRYIYGDISPTKYSPSPGYSKSLEYGNFISTGHLFWLRLV